MKTLVSNIKLGGSFKQFFDWHWRLQNDSPYHCSMIVSSLAKQLVWRCKTKPDVYGTRTAALIGNIYNQIPEGEQREWALDKTIEAIHEANAIIRGESLS